MIATTLIMTNATHMIESKLYIRFFVASIKTTKAKSKAMIMPWMAEVTKAFSDGIQAQALPEA